MYKIFCALVILTFVQCKTNISNDVSMDESIATLSAIDTIIKEEIRLYRGDTLITIIKMRGDTILEKVTSKYRNIHDTERIASMKSRPRTLESSSDDVLYEEMSTAPIETSAMPPPKGRIRPDIPENPDAGQITAGEWNDLNNWEDWKNLLNDNDYFEMQNHWGIYPTERYSVFVTNSAHVPLTDLKVELRSGSEVLWTSRTDNGGKAELWTGLLKKNSIYKSSLIAKIYSKSGTYNFKVDRGKSVSAIIDESCNTKNKVDIMFVVDATGSMGDEINYLKSELKDVVKRSVQNQNSTYAESKVELRIGSVFYRDLNDAYLTKVSPLSRNLDRVYDFISDQRASGGGDYPEAVDAALEEALAQQWSEDAQSRVIFLLLDAPPHDHADIKLTLADQIAEAAERGIKIIPISASGINRETEFLLKFMSVVTNGTYVFITDDSGIGNPHLEPLVKDFEIEKLNDLLVRLISNYTKSNGCKTQIVRNRKVKIYPNPTSNYISVETDMDFSEIRVVSNSGKVVYSINNFKNRVKIDLSFLVAGVYTIQFIGLDYQYSENIILVDG